MAEPQALEPCIADGKLCCTVPGVGPGELRDEGTGLNGPIADKATSRSSLRALACRRPKETVWCGCNAAASFAGVKHRTAAQTVLLLVKRDAGRACIQWLDLTSTAESWPFTQPA